MIVTVQNTVLYAHTVTSSRKPNSRNLISFSRINLVTLLLNKCVTKIQDGGCRHLQFRNKLLQCLHSMNNYCRIWWTGCDFDSEHIYDVEIDQNSRWGQFRWLDCEILLLFLDYLTNFH